MDILAELNHMPQQADGFSDSEDVTISPAEAAQVCPLPWRADGIQLRDATGVAVATALTFDLAGKLDYCFALAQANAQRIAQAVNAEGARKDAIAGAKHYAIHRTLYQLGVLLDKAYSGAPIDAFGLCALCGEHVASSGHDDACPIYDISAALEDERDGRGWNLGTVQR